MTNMETYVRLLTEMHHKHSDRRTFETRTRLQDVLCELRDRAAQERGDESGEETQDEAERLAQKRVDLSGSKTAAVERRALELGLPVVDLPLQSVAEIVFMDKIFEIAGVSQDVADSARKLEECLGEADNSGNPKRIEVAFQTMFALRMLEEVCTNNRGSMTDDQLIVALEYLTFTNREN